METGEKVGMGETAQRRELYHLLYHLYERREVRQVKTGDRRDR